MIPKQCLLWKKEELTMDDIKMDNFELIKDLPEEIAHVSQSIRKCKECGQLYIVEFNDFFADWENNDLPTYWHLVPVSDKELKNFLKKKKTLNSILEIPGPRLTYRHTNEILEIEWNR